jgi:membrane-associated phospholipid phosphatase
VAGGILVVWTVLAGLALRHRRGPTGFDRWGFDLLTPTPHSHFLIRITELADLPVLVAGSIGAAVVVVGRDRWRALACLLAPALATLVVEWYLKPFVARRYVGVLTFPSGSVTTVAALAAAWSLAVPRWLRWVVIPAATVAVGAEAWAVVGLRWHYPSDAMGGAAFGVGLVLLVDGVFHLLSRPSPLTPDPNGGVRAASDPLGAPSGHPQL